MAYSEIKLETKLVGQIEGEFFIPSYQRGYRWRREEVLRLLEDIYANETRNYCLQPVVVKKDGNRYELVDGQQRLTTLYLIYRYMHAASNGFMDEPGFSITYGTRPESKHFLQSIDLARKEENIDFWFMCEAYVTIEQWFMAHEKKSTLTNINKYFDENVKIIWYEVDQSEDTISLFTRLNIGKIPLTSAELVKAMFLSGASGMGREKQEEISLQWDNIEKDLQNNALWFFLANYGRTGCQTRIDLILNLISGKPDADKDPYYTFFYFVGLAREMDLDSIWRNIQHTFLMLKDWFENHEMYHKIGYLIASETASLQSLFHLAENRTKKQFLTELDNEIRKSITIDDNYGDLSYENPTGYRYISRLLLLFNVESVQQQGEQTQWFPFNVFKSQNRGKWSLEHIHAQQSEGLRTQDLWKEWLRLHLPSVETVGGSGELLSAMREAVSSPKLDRIEFEEIQEKVIGLLSVQGNTEYLHSIANLALLNTSDNAALNNSTFDVKRNEIIRMDKQGQYIPFCTRMVFLKYYTQSEDNQLHFWGQADRIAYVKAINTVLKNYLNQDIQTEMEGA